MQFEFPVQLTKGNLIRIVYYYLLRRGIWVAVPLVVMGILAVGVVWLEGSDSAVQALPLWAMILWLAIYPQIRGRMYFRNPNMSVKQQFVHNDEGMRAVSELGNSLSRWAVFRRLVETKSFYVFELDSSLGIFIPKEALRAAGIGHEWKTAVEAWTGKKFGAVSPVGRFC